MRSTPLVIYHDNCTDGLTAAWVAAQVMPDAEFFAGFYGQDPPDVHGRDVFIVDFSYKRPVMEQIAADCATLVVLDHHKTAEAELHGFTPEFSEIVFDMEHSGASPNSKLSSRCLPSWSPTPSARSGSGVSMR
jgi:oligoribonuclease NrnB/cAMP/cGMP phosphodiesterase (DHH superfamily)